MKKNPNSVDGFVPRRSGVELGDAHKKASRAPIQTPSTKPKQVSRRTAVGAARQDQLLGRSDIDESLRDIDTDIPESKALSRKDSRRLRNKNRQGKPKSKAKRIIKWTLIGLLIIVLAVGGYLVYKTLSTGDKILEGNIFDVVKSDPLVEDENGRSNFVIFGTAEDDEGGTHGGANLTDSIMVISIDQDKKDAYMVSLPRDLWVDYDTTGCSVGYQGKLNAQYFCASDDGEDEKAGAAALQKKAGEILGLDIQYYIHMNFTAVVEAVNAVGGVDVKIESEDPRGIQDRNFDWKCNYTCYYVNYKNGETVHLDGERALALARARNAQGGYGLPGGNFDREKNQQKIIKALLEKAVSAGTLTNLSSVTGLLDALGNNLRTNVQTKEVRTLMDIGMAIKPDAIIPLSLVEEGNMLVTTGMVNAQSVVRPTLGLMDYSEIQAYVLKNVTSNPVTREDPHITVLNGGRAAGVAQTEADSLTEKGFTVDIVDNAPDGSYPKVEIYQINKEKTASAAKLKEMYGVTPKTTTPPISVVGETDFVIILGPTVQ